MRSWAWLLLLWLLGCEAGPPKPVEPVWGKQACAHCAMLLSEPRPAAQALPAHSRHVFFDDVGCLVAWLERSGERPRGAWVRDPTDQHWVDAWSARYLSGQRTPMDYGFLTAQDGVSFAEMQAALRRRATELGAAP